MDFYVSARSALFTRISLDRARAKPVESGVGLSGGPFRHSDNLARRRRTSERADAIIQVEAVEIQPISARGFFSGLRSGMLLLSSIPCSFLVIRTLSVIHAPIICCATCSKRSMIIFIHHHNFRFFVRLLCLLAKSIVVHFTFVATSAGSPFLSRIA